MTMPLHSGGTAARPHKRQLQEGFLGTLLRKGTKVGGGRFSFGAQAANWVLPLLAILACAPAALALQPPVITSATNDSVNAGFPYSYTITASNNPTSFNASGLPAGLSVDTNSGKITGTTNVFGTATILLSASNTAGTGTATLSLIVNAIPPFISSPLSTDGSLGVPLRYMVTASGIPAPAFTAAPLPPGLLFDGTNIAGAPLQSGTMFVTLTATNAAGKDTKQLTINVTAPPVITSPLVIQGIVNQPLNYTITATNSPASFGALNLPAGLSSNANTAATGQVAGSPTAAGTFSAVVSATNALNVSTDPFVAHIPNGQASAVVTFAISNVAGAPAIANTPDPTTGFVVAPDGVETVPYIFGIAAANSPTSFTVQAGADPNILPPGLALDPVTGAISGVPALLLPIITPPFPNPKTYTPTIIATNSKGSGQATLSITIKPAVPQITSDVTSIQVAITAQLYEYQATATSFSDPAITANAFTAVFNPVPGIPSGNISMAAVTGLLSGTTEGVILPNGSLSTPNDVGNYSVTLTVSNNRGSSSKTINNFFVVDLLVPGAAPIVITSPLHVVAVVGEPFTYQIAASGASYYGALGEPGNYTPLPGHLVLDPTTGTISGTAQPLDAGTFTILLEAGTLDSATNIFLIAAKTSLTLTILPVPVVPSPPTIISPSAAGVFVGNNVNYIIQTTPDPTDPTQNQLPLLSSATNVPLGLALNPDKMEALSDPTPQIGGIAIQSGVSNVTVSAINAAGSNTQRVAFTVAPVTIISPLTATGTVGADFLPEVDSLNNPVPYTIRASGNPNVFSATGLPGGLAVNTRTGVISGIPTDTKKATAVVFPVVITAANGYGGDSKTLQITINPKPAGAPTITSSLTQSGTDSVPFLYQIQASGGATVYGAVGLPAGLTVGTGSGIISGVTSQVGSYAVIITAGNNSGADAEILNLTINQAPPVLTSSQSDTATLGDLYQYKIITLGSQPQTYAAAGLPPGLALNNNIISGLPSATGVYPVTLTISNQAKTIQPTLTITVVQAPSVLAPITTTGTVGDTTFSFTVTASGFPPPTLTVNPNDLQGTGLSFLQGQRGTNSTPGTFSGTPAVAGAIYALVTASNSAGTTSQTITITINPLAITSAATLAGTVNVPLTPYTITATGNPTTFTATGLPPGLLLDGAVISGTPTAAGTTMATITASNGAALGTGSATLIIGISSAPGAPAILSSLVLAGTKNTPLGYAIVASNNPTSYSATGLPNGLAVDTQTGLLSGTPTASGSTEATISASNVFGTGSATLMVAIANIAGGAAITSPLTATSYVGTNFSYQITSINGPIQNYGASNYPLNLAVDAGSGLLSGQITQGGTFSVGLSAQNAVDTANATLVLTVITPIAAAITSPLTEAGQVGTPFNYQITATGLPAPAVTATGLPPGLTLVGDTITGIPTVQGSYSVPLTATNSVHTDNKTLTITIAEGPLFPGSDDSDGDGFPDELEIALGTDPYNPASTPFNGQPAGVVQVINITSMTIRLNFTGTGKDTIAIQGTLPLEQLIAPAGQKITLVVGGIVQHFTLNARGSAGSGGNTFSLRAPKLMLQGKFTAKLSGDFKQALGAKGLTNAPVQLASRTVRVFILLDDTTVYDSRKLLSYTVNKTGRIGIATAPQTKH